MTNRNAEILRLLQARADLAHTLPRHELRARLIREQQDIRDGWLGIRERQA